MDQFGSASLEQSGKVFASIDAVPAAERWNEHGGKGPIAFRRMFHDSDFFSAVDFVDYTVIPPASTIGRHQHNGNEELYFIVCGSPLITINGQQVRLHAGGFSVVRSGGWHELVNDTENDVEIVVVQVHHA